MSHDEVAELRRRLAEAEDTIRAIREGEVDALVVGDQGRTAVFDIGGDAESYRAFMEVMDVGAAAVDEAGRILYLNGALSDVFGTSLSKVQGRPMQEFVDLEARSSIDNVLTMRTNGLLTKQVTIDSKGEAKHFLLASRPFQLGTTQGFALTFTDVTERVRAEAAEQSERAARAVIASANEAVLVCDCAGIITHANAAASVVYEGNPVGRLFAEAVPLVLPGATGLMQSEDIIAMAVEGTAVRGLEATAPNAPRIKEYLVSAAPLQVGNDEISGCVVTMVDMSQRKAAERQQLLLMRELDHRVKNTLALVLSIAGRTLHHEDTLEGFQRAFTGRIHALSATHNLLADNSWSDLTIQDVIQTELSPYLGNQADRLVLTGLDVAISPRAAIAFGLVIHELATNAAKYGALSSPDGHLDVSFLEKTDGADGVLVIEWRESGGPAVAPPTRKGFGQTVITRSLQYLPNGGADIEYLPSGIRCLIRVPHQDLRP